MIPVLEKMNVTLLSNEVMDFFDVFFMKMKKEREKGYHMVSTQVAFSLHCAVLSRGGTWSSLQKLRWIYFLLSVVAPSSLNVWRARSMLYLGFHMGKVNAVIWSESPSALKLWGWVQQAPQHRACAGQDLVPPSPVFSDCLCSSPGPSGLPAADD